jgi:hypothetical protein
MKIFLKLFCTFALALSSVQAFGQSMEGDCDCERDGGEINPETGLYGDIDPWQNYNDSENGDNGTDWNDEDGLEWEDDLDSGDGDFYDDYWSEHDNDHWDDGLYNDVGTGKGHSGTEKSVIPLGFNVTLTGNAYSKFVSILLEMFSNPIENVLLNSINSDSGLLIEINSNSNSLGTYNPWTNTIQFKSEDDISRNGVAEEIFHAFQNQFYNGKLLEIVKTSPHTGGSNIEFEAKAMYFASQCYVFAPCAVFKNVETLHTFMWDFMPQIEEGRVAEFTDRQQQIWFESLEFFQSLNMNENNLYGTPIDYGLLPEALFYLLNQTYNH